jgi:hypothetical protein
MVLVVGLMFLSGYAEGFINLSLLTCWDFVIQW